MKTVDRESKQTLGSLPLYKNDWGARCTHHLGYNLWSGTSQITKMQNDSRGSCRTVVPFGGHLTLRSYTNKRGHLLISPLKRSSRFKIVAASYCCFITRFLYPSGVFSKICNEHSRHYSTILTGNQTVFKHLTFLYYKLRHCDLIYRPK